MLSPYKKCIMARMLRAPALDDFCTLDVIRLVSCFCGRVLLVAELIFAQQLLLFKCDRKISTNMQIETKTILHCLAIIMNDAHTDSKFKMINHFVIC